MYFHCDFKVVPSCELKGISFAEKKKKNLLQSVALRSPAVCVCVLVSASDVLCVSDCVQYGRKWSRSWKTEGSQLTARGQFSTQRRPPALWWRVSYLHFSSSASRTAKQSHPRKANLLSDLHRAAVFLLRDLQNFEPVISPCVDLLAWFRKRCFHHPGWLKRHCVCFFFCLPFITVRGRLLKRHLSVSLTAQFERFWLFQINWLQFCSCNISDGLFLT